MSYDEVKVRQDAVDKACEALEELGFDAIVVVATWQMEDGGRTAAVQSNSGNWYAQGGLMQALLERRRENARVEERDVLEDEE